MASQRVLPSTYPISPLLSPSLRTYHRKLSKRVAVVDSPCTVAPKGSKIQDVLRTIFYKYLEARKHKFSVRMRFKMRFEGEEAPERSFSGAIVGVWDTASSKWMDSEWRSIKLCDRFIGRNVVQPHHNRCRILILLHGTKRRIRDPALITTRMDPFTQAKNTLEVGFENVSEATVRYNSPSHHL